MKMLSMTVMACLSPLATMAYQVKINGP